MKKLLLTFLLCCISAFAYSASIAWGSKNPAAQIPLSPSGGSLEQYTAYLCVGDATSSLDTVVNQLKNNEWTPPAIGRDGSVLSKNLEVTGRIDASLPAQLANNFTGGTTYYFYVVIIDEIGKYALVSSVNTGVPFSEGTTDPSSSVKWTAEEFQAGSGGWIAIGVPEPTALALLALGVAGTVLRRKVRA